MSPDILNAMDKIASDVFLPMGGLALALLVGWGPPSRRIETVHRGHHPPWCDPSWAGGCGPLRIIVPPFLIIVLYQTIPSALRAIAAIGG
jgi:SNF family Na+-dependent transporter